MQRVRRTFNALTGPPLAQLHRRDVWLTYAQALADGVSLRKAAKRSKSRSAPPSCATASSKSRKARKRSGLWHYRGRRVLLSQSEKGTRKIKGQKSRKRGGKASKRGLSNVHAAVLIARDRTGATTDAVLETVDTQSIMTHLAPIVGDHHLDYPSCGDNHTRGSSASSPR